MRVATNCTLPDEQNSIEITWIFTQVYKIYLWRNLHNSNIALRKFSTSHKKTVQEKNPLVLSCAWYLGYIIKSITEILHLKSVTYRVRSWNDASHNVILPCRVVIFLEWKSILKSLQMMKNGKLTLQVPYSSADYAVWNVTFPNHLALIVHVLYMVPLH